MINRNQITNPDEINEMYFNVKLKSFLFDKHDDIPPNSILIRKDRLINLLNFADNLTNFNKRYLKENHVGKYKLADDVVERIISMYAVGHTQRSIATTLGISVGVVNKYINITGKIFFEE